MSNRAKAAVLAFLLCALAIPCISQDFKRTLELSSPRMNGSDVKEVQKRLLNLGFSEIGEADGWYGPLTKGVVERLQIFLGFSPDGKVDSRLWDSIFKKADSIVVDYLSALANLNMVNHKSLPQRLVQVPSELSGPGGAQIVYYEGKSGLKLAVHTGYGDIGYVESSLYFIDRQIYVLVRKSYYNMDPQNPLMDYQTFFCRSNGSFELKEGKAFTVEYSSLVTIKLILDMMDRPH